MLAHLFLFAIVCSNYYNKTCDVNCDFCVKGRDEFYSAGGFPITRKPTKLQFTNVDSVMSEGGAGVASTMVRLNWVYNLMSCTGCGKET